MDDEKNMETIQQEDKYDSSIKEALESIPSKLTHEDNIDIKVSEAPVSRAVQYNSSMRGVESAPPSSSLPEKGHLERKLDESMAPKAGLDLSSHKLTNDNPINNNRTFNQPMAPKAAGFNPTMRKAQTPALNNFSGGDWFNKKPNNPMAPKAPGFNPTMRAVNQNFGSHNN